MILEPDVDSSTNFDFLIPRIPPLQNNKLRALVVRRVCHIDVPEPGIGRGSSANGLPIPDCEKELAAGEGLRFGRNEGSLRAFELSDGPAQLHEVVID